MDRTRRTTLLLAVVALALGSCAGPQSHNTAGATGTASTTNTASTANTTGETPATTTSSTASATEPTQTAQTGTTPASTGSATPPGAGTTASAQPPAGSTAAPASAERPLHFDREITPADLAGRTLRELALMRNDPYARHGHQFRRPWLNAFFTSQSWYHPTHIVPDTELSAVERANVVAVTHFDVALDRPALTRLRDELLARDTAHALRPGDEVEAVLLASRLGSAVNLRSLGADVARDSSPLDNPAALDALLTVAQLRRMSPRDLRILRYTVYARRGREFHAQSLVDYFENMDWYHADSAYNDARLRRVDRQNIRIIQSVETEMGGPMTEAQIREEDAFAGA